MFTRLLHLLWPKLKPDQFTEFVRKYLDRAYNAKAETTEQLVLEISVEGEPSWTCNLHNLYGHYWLKPWNKTQCVANFMDAFFEIETEKSLPKDILPTIKDNQFIEGLKNEESTKDLELVCEPFNEELVIVYVVDSPKSIRYLSPATLKELGYSFPELKELAIHNLRRLLPDVEIHGKAPVLTLKAGEMFEASLLLLDEMWNKEKLGITGEIVVAAPARGVLLVTDSSDEKGVEKLARTALQISSSASYAISSKLFVRRNGGFEVLS